MNKKNLFIVSLGTLILVTSCGSSVNPQEIDQQVLKDNLDLLSATRKTSDTSYYTYRTLLDEKYGDSYVDPKYQQEVLPVGVEMNDTYVDVGENAPDYGCVLLSNSFGGEVTYTAPTSLNSDSAGRYTLKLEYFIPNSFISAGLLSITINGRSLFDETSSIALPINYTDDIELNEDGSKNFDALQTRYGDQMYPNQKRVLTWQNESLYETTFETSTPLVFELTGTPIIKIANLSDDYLFVGKLTLVPYNEPISYSSYYEKVNHTQGNQSIELNAIDYAYKNNNEVRLSTEQTPTVTPYDSKRKLLNVVYSWEEAGQSIAWDVDIEKAGLYPLTFHYYNSNDNFPTFRTIYIDGEVPYKELSNYPFPTTGSSYKNETLQDENGNTLYVYLTQGHHELKIAASTEPVMEIYKNMMAIYDDINAFAIEIRKITGSSVNEYRAYKLTQKLKYTVPVLEAYRTILYDSYNKIKEIIGNDKSSNAITYFPRMLELVDEFIENADDLPLYLTKFSSGDSCLAKMVADTANTLLASPLILDTIYLTNDESNIRKPNASWISSFKDSLVNLGLTFSSDKYKTELVDGELNIWSARSQAYNDILQAMADNYFTPNTITSEYPEGIRVNIRQMPSEDNLIYAYAANTVPDLALGINSGRAFEFALRGDAAYAMSDFDTSWKYTNNNNWGFTPYYWDAAANVPKGQLLSMLYNDKFYSLPESTSVQLMFVRDDIMSSIGENGNALSSPDTWQDLVGMLSILQSRSMNFYYPVSASGSLKSLSGTAQFILQNGGKLLADDGYTIDLRSDANYNALRLLTNLYTISSLPTEVGSFYNSFRYGTLPLGIGDLGMYLQLKYVAPELSGKWSVDRIPGMLTTPLSDGSYADINGDGVGDQVSRWYISNGSSAMIFNNSKMIDEAWLFLQWWMQTDVQVEYTNSLQSSFGPSVLWHSANIEAAQSLPIDSSVRDVVLEQTKWIIDLQQIPGQYMLQRGLSDIWNAVVFGTSSDGTSTGKLTIGNAIDLQKVVIDREIQRKMEEFGYYDTTLGVGTKPYILRDYEWVNSCFSNYTSGINGGNSSSSACPI